MNNAKKVYIICTEPFPNGTAATQRIICYARALSMEGMKCRILIYRWTEFKPGRNELKKGEVYGIPFEYIGGGPVKPAHKIPRLFSQYWQKLALRRLLRNSLHEGDVVIGYVNSDFKFINPLVDLVHSKGAKYVRELCEIPYYGYNNKAMNIMLDGLFPKFDAFITISAALTELAIEHKRKDAKVLQVPILVDYEAFSLADKSEQEMVPLIFHSGTLLEQKDGICGMLEAFAEAKKRYGKPMKIVLAGNLSDSPDKAIISQVISSCGIAEDVIFTGYLTRDKVFDYMSRAFAVVINKHDNVQNKYGFSTKLGEYLAAGKTVIISNQGEAMNWLENGKNALIVERENTHMMADAILVVLNDKQKRRQLGREARKLCRDKFDYKSHAGNFAVFLQGL